MPNPCSDDFPDECGTAESFPENVWVDGSIENPGDDDWFTFDAKAGTPYTIDFSSETLQDPFARVLGADCALYLGETSALGCFTTGDPASISMLSPGGGLIHIMIDNSRNRGSNQGVGTGTYRVRARELPQPVLRDLKVDSIIPFPSYGLYASARFFIRAKSRNDDPPAPLCGLATSEICISYYNALYSIWEEDCASGREWVTERFTYTGLDRILQIRAWARERVIDASDGGNVTYESAPTEIEVPFSEP